MPKRSPRARFDQCRDKQNDPTARIWFPALLAKTTAQPFLHIDLAEILAKSACVGVSRNVRAPGENDSTLPCYNFRTSPAPVSTLIDIRKKANSSRRRQPSFRSGAVVDQNSSFQVGGKTCVSQRSGVVLLKV